MEHDIGYEIGHFIGSYLPFILLATVTIIVWRQANKKKKRIERENKE
jgi:large-conductance mechanosensitive channel